MGCLHVFKAGGGVVKGLTSRDEENGFDGARGRVINIERMGIQEWIFFCYG